MKYISIVLASVLALTFASCQRDDVDKFGEGGAVSRLKLKFQVQTNDLIEVDTRATEAVESDLQDVYVFIFDENGDPIHYEKIEDLQNTLSEHYARTYTGSITNNANMFQKGKKVYVYAIANTYTQMWHNFDNVLASYEKGRETFRKHIMYVEKLSLEPIGTAVPFTGRVGDDGTVVIDQDGQINTYIRLQRPYAKIDFNFAAGRDNITFQPTGYDLHNMPHHTSMLEHNEILDASTVTYETFTNRQLSLASPMAFSFYMLESLQQAKNSVAAYHDRDKKVVDETTGLNTDEFLNAPDHGAYVVVHGKYTEYAGEDNKQIKYVGDVSYTIHLGDFSKNDFSDFSVRRNHWYTYNVTVNGVDNIIVEAKDNTENQSGAEGYIIDATESAMIYDLDSHYETVLLRIPLAALDPTTGAIAIRDANGLTMRVASPYTEMSEGASPGISDIIGYPELYAATLEDFQEGNKDGGVFNFPRTIKLLTDHKALDVNWIRYVSQNNGLRASSYSASTERNSFNTMDLLLVLGRLLVHIQEDYDKNGGIEAFNNWTDNCKEYSVGGLPPYGSNGPATPENNPAYPIYVVREDNRLYAYLTAFVDEYVYTYHPYSQISYNPETEAHWSEFTNASPRAIYIASSPKTSSDGGSTYAPILYTISQKSIGTPFRTDDPAINAYGFESVDETRPTADHTYLNNTNGSDLDGLNNYRTILATSNNGLTLGTSKWDAFVDFGITSNSYNGPREDHINNMMVTGKERASFLCLQRNRDLNGNGVIDEDEIKWYLPAINQYMSMWIGTEGVLTTARLFDTSTSDAAANMAAYNTLSHMYTSSADSKRIYWAIEGASYGYYERAYLGQYHGVRCARNLQFATEQAPSYSSVLEEETDNSGDRVAVYNLANLAPEAIRSTQSFMRSEYGPHHERQIQNKPAERFQLAKRDLVVPAREIVNLPVLAAPKVLKGVESERHTIPASPAVTADLTYRIGWGDVTYTMTMTLTDPDPKEGWTYGYTDNTTQPSSDSDWVLFDSNNQATVTTTTRDNRTCYVWGRDADGNYTSATRVIMRPSYLGRNDETEVSQIKETTYDRLYFRMVSLLNLIDMTKYDNDGSDLHLLLGDNTEITYEVSVGTSDSYQQRLFEKTADGYYRSVGGIEGSASPVKIRARYKFSKHDATYPSNPVIINLVDGKWVVDESSGQDTEEGKRTESQQNTFQSDYAATSTNLCAKYYSEEADSSDLGLWRVPNQRELAVIVLRGLGPATLTTDASYFSRTTFSNTHVGRTLFFYNDKYKLIQLVTTANKVEDASKVAPISGRIRCVRDREPKKIDRVTPTYDGSYRNGGNLTK